MAELAPALQFVLPHEGGYANDPADPGGETMYGITAVVAREYGYTGAMVDLPLEVATAIYRDWYWGGLDQVTNQAVASKLLDLRVNFGVAGGTKIAQQAVNQLVDPPVSVDGRWGPDTLDAVNTADPKEYLQALADTSAQHYQDIAQAHPERAKFLPGWLSRASDLPGLVVGGVGLVALVGLGVLAWMLAGGRGGRA